MKLAGFFEPDQGREMLDTQDIEIKPVMESEVPAVKPQRKKNLFSILIIVLIVVLILAIPFGKAIQLKSDFGAVMLTTIVG